MTVFLIAACANKQIRLAFETSKELNTGLPLVVRIYQLRNRDRLEQADFQSLWKDDKVVLGEDLVDQREFTLHPNEKMLIEIDREEDAEYVAIMGLFRHPDNNSGWRQVRLLKGWGLTRRLMNIQVYDDEIEVVRY
ncbi:MAG: type VI secretion system lipoprotein TssJ [Nitrospiria bacterium]